MTDFFADAQGHHLDGLEEAYARLLEGLGYDGVLLYSGHPHRHFADDQEASFATYGHFLHWVPLAGLSRSWLLVRAGQPPTLYLHAPRDFWHLAPQLPDEAWAQRFAIVPRDTASPPSLPPGRFAVLGDVDSATAHALGAELNPAPLTAVLDELRVRKSDYEVACLRDANRLAMRGHRAARDAFLAGDSELDVQLAYLKASRQRESEVPYGNIVGINAHGGVLHYQHYDREAPERQHSLLVDAGHRVRGYCADITRTWSGRDADAAFLPLVEAVTALQKRLIAALRPGVSYVALHQRMHDELGALLLEHGLIRGSAEAAVAGGITRAFCPHGLGHLLGLQVHDVAGRCNPDGSPLPPPDADPALRLTRELEAGMVITMEPGLYIIPMLLAPLRDRPAGRDIDWGRVDHLAPHGGIRIEDNLLITATGAVNLTRSDS